LNIVYLAQSRIPSREANSIHVMRMCQAFVSTGHEVTLVVPNFAHSEVGVNDVFSYYGVRPCFELVRVPARPRRGRLHRYGPEAALIARARKPDLVYSRSLKATLFCSLLGLP
jgi:hypothetical protein